jgi:outer membrane protein
LGGKLLGGAQWVFMLSMLTVLLGMPASISAREIKIGVVNTEKILRESVPAIIAQKKIEKEFLAYDERIKKMAAQIKLLQEQLEKNDKSMAVEERRAKERELANISRQYQRAQQQMREDLSMRQNEEYSLILEHVNQAIKNIAEKEDYDLILQLQDSVYRSQRIDITNQVIKALAEQE